MVSSTAGRSVTDAMNHVWLGDGPEAPRAPGDAHDDVGHEGEELAGCGQEAVGATGDPCRHGQLSRSPVISCPPAVARLAPVLARLAVP